jgi:hypothetical protein
MHTNGNGKGFGPQFLLFSKAELKYLYVKSKFVAIQYMLCREGEKWGKGEQKVKMGVFCR